MTELIKIGNSQGVRIPKALIEAAGLENRCLIFKITSEGLLIVPKPKKRREGWREKIEMAIQNNELDYDWEWLEADLDSELGKL
ncbi:MAG: hypothetical protein R2865_04590 [Deinococcales bacterium]